MFSAGMVKNNMANSCDDLANTTALGTKTVKQLDMIHARLKLMESRLLGIN